MGGGLDKTRQMGGGGRQDGTPSKSGQYAARKTGGGMPARMKERNDRKKGNGTPTGSGEGGEKDARVSAVTRRNEKDGKGEEEGPKGTKN